MLPSKLVSLSVGNRVEWQGGPLIGGWVLRNDEHALVIGWDDGRLTTLTYHNNAEVVTQYAERLETALPEVSGVYPFDAPRSKGG